MIEDLWREHLTAPFPQTAKGREVAGNDLVLLDSTTAGCISTYVSRGSLDIWRLSILGLCYHSLVLVTAQLNGDEREYFARLEMLAGMVLEKTREASHRRQDS